MEIIFVVSDTLFCIVVAFDTLVWPLNKQNI